MIFDLKTRRIRKGLREAFKNYPETFDMKKPSL